MNKTVSINLGGTLFYIDEDAFQLLSQYLDSVKASLSNSESQDEIVKDIEMRLAELLFENRKDDKSIVNQSEVERIISILGQPNDFRIDDNDDNKQNTNSNNNYYNNNVTQKVKKLYRDADHSTIGGVAAGLGHYFGMDKIWFRILFLIFIFAGFGTGIIIYIILWAVTPEAKTTSEKLEMQGEPITISNIEKKVQQEFDGISKRIKDTDYQELGDRAKRGVHKIEPILYQLANIVMKLVGIFFIFISIVMLICLLGVVFAFGTTSMLELPWQNYINAFNYTEMPSFLLGVINFLAFGIPFILMLILGTRLLNNGKRSIGKVAKYTLLTIWIFSVFALITITVKQVSEISFTGKSFVNQNITLNPSDTLKLRFKHNDFYSKDTDEIDLFKITNDNKNESIIYSNDIAIHILKTSKKEPYIKIEKSALGKNYIQAKQFAENIQYEYKIENNSIILDNYFITKVQNKFRDQEIQIYLYLPEGTIVAPDANVANYITSEDSDFDFQFEHENEIYRVGTSFIECKNCDTDLSNDSLQVKKTVLMKIGGKEIIRTETHSKTSENQH